MAIISFMNMKGGVGKTTLCVNLADALATYHNKKVLIIDMDPQFNSSQYLLRVMHGKDHIKVYENYKKNHKTIYSLYDEKQTDNRDNKKSSAALFNTKTIDDSHLKKSYTVNIKKNLDIILGDIDLLEIQINQKSGAENILKKHIELADLREKYEYIFIDSPPTYSVFFISSYLSCDAYILPVKPDYLSSTGIALLSRAEDSIFQTFAEKKIALGIIYTLIDPRNHLHVPVQEEIEEEVGKENIFNEEIKYFKSIPEGLSNQKLMLEIFENKISTSIKNLSEEFISRIENNLLSIRKEEDE
ncbi:ParA family protein [uncultured Rummeliibacillus sp.]|uniref:ParA family protein n=1 Tax=uncultured Rummeliibacillus sp. TaxID=762292 RepID=UPI00261C5FBB|nr:ParA family protein [uncultured Rummeliibacillus sp.]